MVHSCWSLSEGYRLQHQQLFIMQRLEFELRCSLLYKSELGGSLMYNSEVNDLQCRHCL